MELQEENEDEGIQINVQDIEKMVFEKIPKTSVPKDLTKDELKEILIDVAISA